MTIRPLKYNVKGLFFNPRSVNLLQRTVITCRRPNVISFVIIYLYLNILHCCYCYYDYYYGPGESNPLEKRGLGRNIENKLLNRGCDRCTYIFFINTYRFINSLLPNYLSVFINIKFDSVLPKHRKMGIILFDTPKSY